MRKIIFHISVVITILLSGCGDLKQESVNFMKIKIDVEKSTTASVHDWFTSIELIPLETKEHSVFQRCSKILPGYHHRYYVQDGRQQAIFVFDSLGNFLFNTSSLKGKQSEQYLGMTDFDLSRDAENLILLDPHSARFQIYDKDGQFIKSVPFLRSLLPLSKFKVLFDDLYLFYICDRKKEQKSIQIFSASKNKIIKSKYSIPPKAFNMVDMSQYPFYEYNDDVYFTHFFPNNDIYRINTENLDIEKALEYDFGKYTFTINFLPDDMTSKEYSRFDFTNRDRFAFMSYKGENKYMYLSFIYFGDQKFISMYDKRDGAYRLNSNEFNEGMYIFPPKLMDDEYMYVVVEPINVKYVIAEELLDAKSKAVLSRLKEDDNPVIVKYKFNYSRK